MWDWRSEPIVANGRKAHHNRKTAIRKAPAEMDSLTSIAMCVHLFLILSAINSCQTICMYISNALKHYSSISSNPKYIWWHTFTNGIRDLNIPYFLYVVEKYTVHIDRLALGCLWFGTLAGDIAESFLLAYFTLRYNLFSFYLAYIELCSFGIAFSCSPRCCSSIESSLCQSATS